MWRPRRKLEGHLQVVPLTVEAFNYELGDMTRIPLHVPRVANVHNEHSSKI